MSEHKYGPDGFKLTLQEVAHKYDGDEDIPWKVYQILFDMIARIAELEAERDANEQYIKKAREAVSNLTDDNTKLTRTPPWRLCLDAHEATDKSTLRFDPKDANIEAGENIGGIFKEEPPDDGGGQYGESCHPEEEE